MNDSKFFIALLRSTARQQNTAMMCIMVLLNGMYEMIQSTAVEIKCNME